MDETAKKLRFWIKFEKIVFKILKEKIKKFLEEVQEIWGNFEDILGKIVRNVN